MKRFYEVIQDEAGNILVGAEVYLRKQSDSSLVTVYSDDGVTTTANPLVSGTDGYVSCWTADNVLKIEVYVDGELEKTISYWQHFDAEDNEIKALRSVTSAADKLFYFTGSGTGAVTDFSAFGRTLVDDANAAAARTTLGVVIGTDVQAYDALLASIAGLTFGADNYIYGTGSDTAAVGTITTAGRAILDDADASAQRTTLGLGTIATFDEATTAQVRSNTSGKALSTDKTWAAADYVALTDATTVDVDMSAGINFSLTIGGNRTLGAPTNTKNGQAGEIIITQDGTGSRTLAYHANWKFAGGTDPVLSTAAGAVDVLSYKVVNSTFIIASLSKGFA